MHKVLNNVGARSESKAKFAGKVEHQMAMDEISACGKWGWSKRRARLTCSGWGIDGICCM